MKPQQHGNQPDQQARHSQDSVERKEVRLLMIPDGRKEVPQDLIQVHDSVIGHILPAVVREPVVSEGMRVDKIAQAGESQRPKGQQQGRQRRAEPVLFLRPCSPLAHHGGKKRSGQQRHGADHHLPDALQPGRKGNQPEAGRADPELPTFQGLLPLQPAERRKIQPHRQVGHDHVKAVIVMVEDNPPVGHAEGQQHHCAGHAEPVEGDPRLPGQEGEGSQHHQLHQHR